MGSTFHLPVLFAEAETLIEQCRRQKVRLVVAAGGGQQVYCSFDWTRPAVLVMGNEGQGVSAPLRSAAENSVSIPIVGSAESLNVAAAGAVLLFEAARQRGFMLSD
jgi:TrmH family RNA methyltransferase